MYQLASLTFSEEQITMRLTYENAVSNDDRVFHVTTEWFRTTRKSTYEIMRDRERVNQNFRCASLAVFPRSIRRQPLPTNMMMMMMMIIIIIIIAATTMIL